MPRGRKATSIALVPESVFTQLSWWDKLNANEQQTVKAEGEQLAVSLLNYGKSRLAIGEHLLSIKEVLEPKQLFVKFLRNFHFSVKTAYRYMNGFTNAKAELHEKVLQGAMARGLNMIGESEDKPLGIYTEAARQLAPPSHNPTTDQVNAWLDSVETVRKKIRSGAGVATNVIEVVNPEMAMKECVRFIENRYNKLPHKGRTQSAFAKNLCGYILTIAGIEESVTVEPTAIPAGFRAERGRPKLVKTEQATKVAA